LSSTALRTIDDLAADYKVDGKTCAAVVTLAIVVAAGVVVVMGFVTDMMAIQLVLSCLLKRSATI
jgi:UPF0716 family protein affecting phage T7 exclusion